MPPVRVCSLSLKMPGLLTHIAFGIIIGAAGINFLRVPANLEWQFLFFCVFMSCLPDVFYPLAYFDFITMQEYSETWIRVGHILVPFLALSLIVLLVGKVDIPYENLVLVGLVCVIVHAVVDLYIPNRGILI